MNGNHNVITKLFGCMLLLLGVMVAGAVAQPESTTPAESGYRMPPQEIADLIDVPRTPLVSLSPDNRWILLAHYPSLISIEELAQPELRLAGSRINPRTNGPSRGWYFTQLSLRSISGSPEREITGLPENAKLTNIRWSPDGKHIAFNHATADGIELWVADIKSAQARKLETPHVNATYGAAYTWLSGGKGLLVKTIPEGRGGAPAESIVPDGPIVQENLGRKAPARTYQDLLKNSHDEALFEYYFTSQLVSVTLDGKVQTLGSPGIISSMSPSPDGKYILMETIHRPYSYTVPAYRFPRLINVWDMTGEVVYELIDRPLADMIPIAFGSVTAGPRSMEWRADADATLAWAEAQDGGDAGLEADERDRVFMLPAPFDKDPIPLATFALRFSGTTWGNGKLAYVSEWWWTTRMMRIWKVQPDNPDAEPVLIEERSFEDRYADPGTPMMRSTGRGTSVMITANGGKTIFLSGDGASDEGDRPFVDEYNVETKETKRLFRSEAPYYEVPWDLIDSDKRILITRRESVTEPPNYFMRDLERGELAPITEFPHPTPQLLDVTKEQIRYQRADGVDLTGKLYLPPGYKKEDGPLPVIMWAYPQEYKSKDAAGQVTESPYRFVRVGWWSPLLWLVQGYAVLDDPAMPIVGEGDEEPNDTYVEQLVASARAAIEELDRRGVGDPERVAIGGHSYGAFMAANLLAHSDLFRAGLPRSGAYNRTLTPFGFQSEERTIWEAPDVYFTMSPFLHADKINEPILLVHGEADNNSGTFPLQSERFYGALKGMGATARLVMLPHESHSYRARESVMHLLWETTEWLDKYVKNAEPREVLKTKKEGGAADM